MTLRTVSIFSVKTFPIRNITGLTAQSRVSFRSWE